MRSSRRAIGLLLAAMGSCNGPKGAQEAPTALVVVRSRDGPVPGARVELFAGPAEDGFTDMDALAFRPAANAPGAIRSATADRDGRVVLDVPPGTYWISAAAPGFARETAGVSVDRVPRETRVSLVPGAPLSGTITGGAGPLAGIEVIAAPLCRVWPCDAACDRTRTDSLGCFRFGALAPGDHGIWYRPEGGPPVSAGRVRVPLVSHLPVDACKGGAVAGVVRDADTDVPLVGAVVRVTGVLGGSAYWATPSDEVIVETRTNAAGRFEAATHLPICILYGIGVRAEGYAPSPVVPATALPAFGFAEGQRLDLDVRLRRGAARPANDSPGRARSDDGPVETAPPPVVAIRGRVRARDGAALAGARVAAFCGEPAQDAFLLHFDSLREAVADAGGGYELRLPSDDMLIVWAWSPTDGALGSGAWEEEPATGTQSLDITTGDDRMLSGRAVLAGSSRGIDGLRVSVATDYFGMSVVTICAVTGADGRFSVGLPRDEEARVWFSGKGLVPKVVTPDNSNDIVVEMQPDLPVTGVVRLEDGSPAVAARVTLHGDEWYEDATTDTGGRFVIGGVTPGEYEIRAVAEGFESVLMPLGAGAKGVEIRLARVSAEEASARSPAGDSGR